MSVFGLERGTFFKKFIKEHTKITKLQDEARASGKHDEVALDKMYEKAYSELKEIWEN